MAKNAYVGVTDKAQKAKNIYVGINGKARKVLKGYVGVAGKARQFWPAITTIIYNIFSGGRFDSSNVPNTVDIESNVVTTSGAISTLAQYFGTDKTLWTKRAGIMPNWCIDQEGCIVSNYDDYETQMVKDSIYIPINEITNPSTLRITARGNLIFNTGYIDTNDNMVESSQGYICSDVFVDRSLVLSGQSKVDYVRIGAPESGTISQLVANPRLEAYLDPGEPVEEWKYSANGWVQHFTNPIEMSADNEVLVKWEETFYDWQGMPYIYYNGVGVKDLTGNGKKYITFIIDTQNYYYVYLEIVSEEPFSGRLTHLLDDSSTGIVEWDDDLTNANEYTYFNKTYYVLYNTCYMCEYAIQTLHLFYGIETQDLDSFFQNGYYLTNRGVWTMAHILLNGVLSGGCLQRVKKIEIVSEE